MTDQVIVFVADAKFLDHTKALAVNCRRQGDFSGDFLWIVPDNMHAPDVYDLTSRGVSVLLVPDRGFLMKFDLFHPYLSRWRQALYLDADCVVQRPLLQAFDQLDAANPWKPFPEIQGKKRWKRDGNTELLCQPERPSDHAPIIADYEEGPAFTAWKQWDPAHVLHGLRVDDNLQPTIEEGSLYGEMAKRFPHILSGRMFNTAMMCWEPASIDADTVDQLRDLQAEFGECNLAENGGTDQQIIDLLLHGRMKPATDKLWCWWGLDAPQNRVESEGRGWKGGEVPVVVHYGRWYSPWRHKKPGMDAYSNDRIGDGVVCYDFYQQNLAAFDGEFPRNSRITKEWPSGSLANLPEAIKELDKRTKSP